MKKIVILALFTFNSMLSWSAYAEPFLEVCNNCSQQKIKDNARHFFDSTAPGSYDIVFMDYVNEKITKAKVYVSLSDFGDLELEFGSSSNKVVKVILSPQDVYLNSKIKLLKSIFDEIDNTVSNGYEMDSNFPFRSVYEALQEPVEFLENLNYVIKKDSRISTKVQNIKSVTEVIASTLGVQVSSVVASANVNILSSAYVSVKFRDGTSILVKISLGLINGEATLIVNEIKEPLDEQGNPVPRSKFVLRDASYSGVGAAFIEYLDSLPGISVTSTNLGSTGGSTSCPIDLKCDSSGEKCIARINCG